MLQTETSEGWAQQLKRYSRRIRRGNVLLANGRLRRLIGMTLEAEGCQVPVGQRCMIVNAHRQIEAEVVGFDSEKTFLIPLDDFHGITPGAHVIPKPKAADVQVGDALLGRVIDGLGNPLDGKGPVESDERVPLYDRPLNPLHRKPVTESLDVGVRAINAFTTIGQGQRIGLFAGSGIGKSVLLGMMTRFTEADVIVVGLIGERGREVQEFVDHTLGEQAMRRAVVVASPADTSPIHRIHAAERATVIARHFRDRGQRVLLLMDSLTRYAQAEREIALAVGEPPATKGYTASVFSKLSDLVERSGNGAGTGSMTSVYTVLVEGDDHNDPVADAARSFLDGHIVLSRELAEAGIYPAVDVESSISRVMSGLITPRHRELVGDFIRVYAAYQQNRDLITVGAYAPGSDPLIDEAIARRPAMLDCIRQQQGHCVSLAESIEALASVLQHDGETASG
ncbi:MAG: FliI/YscN family ATPase [Xanthomonadales bacterium]|nr:FliI/YscN family ATPase [Xanthomonadales bacterium]